MTITFTPFTDETTYKTFEDGALSNVGLNPGDISFVLPLAARFAACQAVLGTHVKDGKTFDAQEILVSTLATYNTTVRIAQSQHQSASCAVRDVLQDLKVGHLPSAFLDAFGLAAVKECDNVSGFRHDTNMCNLTVPVSCKVELRDFIEQNALALLSTMQWPHDTHSQAVDSTRDDATDATDDDDRITIQECLEDMDVNLPSDPDHLDKFKMKVGISMLRWERQNKQKRKRDEDGRRVYTEEDRKQIENVARTLLKKPKM